MLEIAICDDEISMTNQIEQMLEEVKSKCVVELEINVFYDGETLVNSYLQKHKYDIIFMDIEMSKKSGIDAAWEIRKIDKKVLLIFITRHESFAKEVFEVSAFRFITKPIDQRIFERYFFSAINQLNDQQYYFQYQYNKIYYKILLKDIMYFQSDRRITYIVTERSYRKCYEKLNNIEKKLINSNIYFYRIHQSFFVNPKFVDIYMFDSMKLIDGTILSISENRRKKINELFCKLKGDEIID